jgi:hypothetical protein
MWPERGPARKRCVSPSYLEDERMTKEQPRQSPERDRKPDREAQPGTGKDGKSWQSRSPDPKDKDDKLNQALKDSFPASDPPQPAQPGVTGWDAEDDAVEKAGGKR